MATCLSASSSSSEAYYHKPAAFHLGDAFMGGGLSFSHGDLGSSPDRVTNAHKCIVITTKLKFLKRVRAASSASDGSAPRTTEYTQKV